MCEHPTSHVKFIVMPCDYEYPALWKCDLCQTQFTSDPNDPTSVRYTAGPQTHKVITLKSSKV